MAYAVKFQREETHRLVPTKYSESGSVLEKLNLPSEVLADLSEIDAATNDRKTAEQGGSLYIGPNELLMGVPEAQIVNAAFCHPGPGGSRFNDSHRGAWYAGVELETSMAEVAYHKKIFIRDSRIAEHIAAEYQDFLAGFDGMFHQLEPEEQAACLQPDPIPDCYAAGQKLANVLLHSGSQGIVYPSVRNFGGTCIACFRPAIILHPRRGARYEITVEANTSHFTQREIS